MTVMSTVSMSEDTAGRIRAIDAMSEPQCDLSCWHYGPPVTNVKERFRWIPGQPILRFGPSWEAA